MRSLSHDSHEPDRLCTVALGIVLCATLAAHTPAAIAQMPREPFAPTRNLAPHKPTTPCSERLQPVPFLPLQPGIPAADALLRSHGALRMVGVEENVRVHRAGNDGQLLRVRYPKGSASFSVSRGANRPLGGAAYYGPVAHESSVSALCVRYRVRFPTGFDFVKGGKLPGLYAGSPPSGGDRVTGENGWSVRLMWRRGGKGELYEYIYNKGGDYGLSVGRGSFRFARGRWVAVELEVVLNQPGRRNGIARLWVDDKAVIEQRGVVYRTRETGATAGLMFSTFFGGGDTSWATPRDQHVDFNGLRLYLRQG